jgi:MoaA/NifB/PqqE/SkfB family radical SAM enzyme
MGLLWKRKFWPIRILAGIHGGGKTYGGPVVVNVGLTDQCNLRCIHCRYRSPKKIGRLQEKMDRSYIADSEHPPVSMKSGVGEADSYFVNSLIETLAALGTPRIIFAGDGEPFLHRNVLDFIARAKHSGQHTAVFTNGTLLDRDTVDELLHQKLDVLRISVLSTSAEEYVSTHPGTDRDAFDQLKDRILYLRDRKKAQKSGAPRLVLYTTVLAQNCEGLAALPGLSAELGADEVVFLALHDIGGETIAPLAPGEQQAEILQKQVASIAAQLDEKKVRHNLRAFINVFHKGRLQTGNIYQEIPCYYGWLGSVIKPDGNVFFCCPAHRPVGNLNEQSFTRLWNSSAYERLRKEAITIHKRSTPVSETDCYKCVHYAANLRLHRFLRPFSNRFIP